jgi:hypothetical protein
MAALKRCATQKLNGGSLSLVGTPEFLGICRRPCPVSIPAFLKARASLTLALTWLKAGT